MKTEVKKWLHDALHASQTISAFTGVRDLTEYENDLMLRSAVERQFRIVGEALNRTLSADASLVDQIVDISRIVGLQNRIIHGYGTVDNQIV